MKCIYVNQLPTEVQTEFKKEAFVEIAKSNPELTVNEINDIIKNEVMTSKLSDVIGYEVGMVDPNNFKEYI